MHSRNGTAQRGEGHGNGDRRALQCKKRGDFKQTALTRCWGGLLQAPTVAPCTRTQHRRMLKKPRSPTHVVQIVPTRPTPWLAQIGGDMSLPHAPMLLPLALRSHLRPIGRGKCGPEGAQAGSTAPSLDDHVLEGRLGAINGKPTRTTCADKQRHGQKRTNPTRYCSYRKLTFSLSTSAMRYIASYDGCMHHLRCDDQSSLAAGRPTYAPAGSSLA